MKEKKLKAYFVNNPKAYDDGGVGVISTTVKEAKKLAFRTEPIEDIEWIDLRVKLVKNANIDELKAGYIFITDEEAIDAMFRRVYGSGLEHVKCPNCGKEDTYVFELYDDVFGCSDCEKKLTEEDINNPYVKKQQEGVSNSSQH